MKHFILYLLLSSTLFSSCKIDKKTSSANLLSARQQDSVIKQDQVVQETSKSLKEKLIGKVYRKANEIREFDNYNINGGFTIGSTFNNENIINGKEYSICRLREKNGKTKILVLEEIYERSGDGKAYFKVLDLLEVEKETDIFKKYPNKDIDIFTDVLLKGKRAPELLALAEYEEAEEMTNVYKVWRANRTTGKFEEVKDISGITVVNEDY